MTEQVSSVPPAQPGRWWSPFVSIGVVLAAFGTWLNWFSRDGRAHVIGMMCIGAAVIAFVGVLLSFTRVGRSIMGVRVYRRALFPFLFSKRGWIQAVIIVILFGTVGFGEYTMHPDFCQSCHLMVPYYQAWHESTHKGVSCIDCHFEPGIGNTIEGKWRASSMVAQYLTNTYGSKPHAEISDESCIRTNCHSERNLHGKVEWKYEKPNGAVVNIHFDHEPHLGQIRRGRKLKCVSCHSQIVQGRHITVTLDTCFICHFKGLRHGRDQEVLGGCTGCHAAPKETIRLATGMFNHKEYIDRGVGCYNCHSDSTKGEGEVPRQVCLNCHNTLQHLERFGDTNFIHDNHVTTHKVECTGCHLTIEHRIDANTSFQGADCNRCHVDMHTGPAELYRGTGGRGVMDMPSPMYRAQVDCIACHQFKEFGEEHAAVIGQTYVAAQKSCDMCHGDTPDPSGGKYATKLADWKQAIGDLTQRAQSKVQQAEKALISVPTADPQKKLDLQRRLADAKHNLAFVELGRGVHNFNYSVALLNLAMQNGDEVIQVVDSLPKQPDTPNP